MNCEQYLALDHQERFLLIGQVVHLLQNDSESFEAMSSMVRSATQIGIFEGVKIGHAERGDIANCKGCGAGVYRDTGDIGPFGGHILRCDNCGDEI